jgi:hypothetical protein
MRTLTGNPRSSLAAPVTASYLFGASEIHLRDRVISLHVRYMHRVVTGLIQATTFSQ